MAEDSSLVDEQLRWEELDASAWLSSERETFWFLALNFKKLRANQLRGTLDPDRPRRETVEQIERLLDESIAIRNGLIRVFMKLVTSLSAKFLSPRHPMDELMSEGNAILLRAVEMFDADRGFRFSTYATHAVRRNLCRHVSRKTKLGRTAAPEELALQPDERRWTPALEQSMFRTLGRLDDLFAELKDRDAYILRSRYGMCDDGRARTLQDIADELGVSRERVRQLERRALEKLRKLAEANRLELPE